ncbi:hypothetical protein Aperf_G00000126327 [Anoplocephala perfoliata]
MLNEAENSLLGPDCTSKQFSEALQVFGEQACYAFLLLGDVYKLQNDYQKAQLCYKECLKLNPMMWTPFQNLCSISEFVDPEDVFKMSPSHGILTPTFTVVGQSVTSAKSSINVSVKAERDKLGSRENLNPNSPVKETSEIQVENDSGKLNTSAQIVKSTYVTPCTVVIEDFSATHSLTPEDLSAQFTPVGFPVTTIAPAAPIINKEEVQTKNSFAPNEFPSFGGLSTIFQSPMFACLPVFSRLDFNATLSTSGSEGLQPVRLALTQTMANRRSTSRQASLNNNHLQAAILFNSTDSGAASTAVQWRAKDANVSTPAPSNQTAALYDDFIGPSFGRASGVTPLPPWISNTPISNAVSLDSTSSPPYVVSATFNAPKTALLFNDTGNTSLAGFQLNNSPMDTTEPSESLQRDPSPDTSAADCFVEPRTRAQKARAAASGGQRKSPRLSRTSKASVDELNTEDGRKSFVRFAPTAKIPPRISGGSTLPEHSRVVCTASFDRSDPRYDVISAYLHLLRCLGQAYSLLTQHNYRGSVALLSEIPFEHLATGRLLTWAARAHVDAADYSKARRIFNELRRLEPWQLYGMDFYSTVLWYQGAEQELSQLASDLLTLDRSASIPWSVAGNYYALLREHDTSIRFLRRAIQVCPTDSYACTLLGHEYVAVENLDRAASAFRHALRLDERNYSARFGLSNVYFKQDYFGLADAHLVRALSIFPNSCLLLTHLGAIRARIGRLEGDDGSAINLLNKAVNIDPTNPMALYHRACILTQLGRYQDAIEELERLMVITPHEAMIYFMLGNAYQKVGDAPKSMIYFSWAMELDPKGVNANVRDIMAGGPSAGILGPGGHQQTAVAPFVCAAAAALAGPTVGISPATETSSANSQSSRINRRGGGAGGGGGTGTRARRSVRGRPSVGRGGPPHRSFLSGTTSTATTPGIVTNLSLTLEEEAGSANALFRPSWSGQSGRESGIEETEEELGVEEEDETMDMGDE